MTEKSVDMTKSVPEGLPPGVLLLHSPWMTNKDSNNKDRYVGTPTDPLLISCTYMNELEGKSPAVIDRFISFCKDGDGFWDVGDSSLDTGVSDERTADHRHNLDHDHYGSNVGMTTSGSGKVDDDDGGASADPVAPQHHHDVTLNKVLFSVTENIPGTDGEGYPPLNPVHYEVSAYHVDPTQNAYASVPAGTIVFARFVGHEWDDEVGGYPGWQRMDNTPLKRDSRETDTSYIPKVWKNVALRIAGCIPSKKPMGRRYHTHDTPPHFHDGGSAEGNHATIRVDPDGNFIASYNDHTHDVSYVSEVNQQVTFAENLRRHLKIPCFMAKVDGAPLFKGMMVPFIPRRGSDDVIRATGTGVWTIVTQETSKKGDPILAVTQDVGDFRQYDPDSVQVVNGQNAHTHDYDHHHVVGLSQARNPRNRRLDSQDDDYEVSRSGHTHGDFVISDQITSSESINPLQYRRVFFLERQVDDGEA